MPRPDVRAHLTFPAVAGLTVDNVKIAAIAALVVLALLALAVASVIRKFTAKVVAIAVLAGAGYAVWTQRSAVQECATRAKDRIDIGEPGGVICTFFGRSVTVPTAERSGSLVSS